MKRWVLICVLIWAAFAYCLPVPSLAATLNLRATWTANVEPDMRDYRLYRTDGTRVLINTISHPTTTYDFSVVVPDGSTGILTFVLTAGDLYGNYSPDSTPASYPYSLDTTPPAAPRNLIIQLR